MREQEIIYWMLSRHISITVVKNKKIADFIYASTLDFFQVRYIKWKLRFPEYSFLSPPESFSYNKEAKSSHCTKRSISSFVRTW